MIQDYTIQQFYFLHHAILRHRFDSTYLEIQKYGEADFRPYMPNLPRPQLIFATARAALNDAITYARRRMGKVFATYCVGFSMINFDETLNLVLGEFIPEGTLDVVWKQELDANSTFRLFLHETSGYFILSDHRAGDDKNYVFVNSVKLANAWQATEWLPPLEDSEFEAMMAAASSVEGAQ